MKKITKVRNRIVVLAAGLMIAATTQAALVGHWTFDETSGTTASNSAAAGLYDGTVANPTWTSGVIGGALRFDGTCNVSDFGAVLTDTATELSISVWCYGDASQPNGNLFSAYATGTNAYRRLNCHLPHSNERIYFDAQSYPSFNQRDRIDKAYVGEKDLVWGAWNHWVFTKNATNGTMAMYVNGALWHDGTGLTNLMDNTAAFIIGSDDDTLLYQGLMDDFRVYDHALSPTEISDLYTAVTPDYAVAEISASPEVGTIPLEVVFNGSNSVSTGVITSYDWDFGDGTTTNGMIVTHTYTAVGTNTVTLTVTDDSGNTNIDQVEIIAEAVTVGAPIKAGDTLAIDFGATAPTVTNYNQVSVITQGGFDYNVPDLLVRLSDGVATDVGLGMEMVGVANRNQDDYVAGNGGNTNASSIYSDGIATWDSGGASANDNSITLTFTGLDDDLTYDIVGGSSRTDGFIESFSTDWMIGGITNHSDNTVSNGYVTFTGVTSTGGTLVVTLTDPVYRVGVAQLELTAVSTTPDVPVIAYTNNTSSLTWNASGEFLYSVQSNLNLQVESSWGTFTNVVGTPPRNTIDLPAKVQDEEFYRVIVE